MEKKYQQNKGMPVCANCGAVCGCADNKCKYCGASLEGVATIPKKAHNKHGNANVSAAFQKGYQYAKHNLNQKKSAEVGALSILSLAFGVISVLLMIFTDRFGLPAVAGLVLGIIALNKRDNVRLSILGVVMSGLVLLIGTFWSILPFVYFF